MNNEPVAYGMLTFCKNCGEQNPYKYKELTDKEIIEIANKCLVGATAWHNPEIDPIEFAKAILRKAQEK